MKNNLRGRISEFLASEDGKVGVKSPLVLGMATGSVFLAQAIIGTTPAMACNPNGNADQCPGGHCQAVEVCIENNAGKTCWDVGICM